MWFQLEISLSFKPMKKYQMYWQSYSRLEERRPVSYTFISQSLSMVLPGRRSGEKNGGAWRGPSYLAKDSFSLKRMPASIGDLVRAPTMSIMAWLRQARCLKARGQRWHPARNSSLENFFNIYLGITCIEPSIKVKLTTLLKEKDWYNWEVHIYNPIYFLKVILFIDTKGSKEVYSSVETQNNHVET